MPRLLSSCVKHANNLWQFRGIVCEMFSTVLRITRASRITMWVTSAAFTHTVYTFYTANSTAKMQVSYLLKWVFSPLSTLPITDTTFYKKGEI